MKFVAVLADTQNNLDRAARIYRLDRTDYLYLAHSAQPVTYTYLVDLYAWWATRKDDPDLTWPTYLWYDTRKFDSLPEALAYAQKQFNLRYYNTSYG